MRVHELWNFAGFGVLGTLVAAAFSARVLSIVSAEVMKLCQISAGKVPPSTGPPLNEVVIGTRPSG